MKTLRRDFEIVRITYAFSCGCLVTLVWDRASMKNAQDKHNAIINAGKCEGQSEL